VVHELASAHLKVAPACVYIHLLPRIPQCCLWNEQRPSP
jgi:hypothetical protein